MTIDIWAPHFIDDDVMKGLKPGQPFIDASSSLIACGSGLSAMLRRREFAKHAQVMSPKKFGALLPMSDNQPIALAEMVETWDWILRRRGSGPVGADEQADRIRRRAKRAIRQSNAIVLTFGSGGAGAPTAADIYRNFRQLSQLLLAGAPDTRIVFAIDAAPAGVGSDGPGLVKNIAQKSTLRAGFEEFLAAETSLNQRVFYFPIYELTLDYSHVAPLPTPVLDLFRAYYSTSGPSKAEAARAFLVSRLRKIANVRRGAGFELIRKTAA